MRPPTIDTTSKRPAPKPSKLGDAIWGSGIKIQIGKIASTQIVATQIRNLYLRLKAISAIEFAVK
jgi:hypothetical protein